MPSASTSIESSAGASWLSAMAFTFVLGASLARLEARVAFETLFSRCQKLELAADSIPMLDSAVLRGPKSIPLRVEVA